MNTRPRHLWLLCYVAIYVCAELSSRLIAGIQLHVRSASHILLSPLTLWSGYSYSYLSTPLAVYFSLNIHNTHSSYITLTLAAVIVVKVSCCLIKTCIGCSKLIFSREILWLHQVPPTTHSYDTDRRSDRTLLLSRFTQHPKINFPEV